MFNFQAFIRRKWSEVSASSGQKGTVVDELAVKPTGLIMSDLNNTLVQQRKVNDISNWEDMTDEELDFFGNKFFYPRIDGDFTFGSVRIWFDEKQDITIGTDAVFISEDGFRFIAIQPGVISRSSFKNSVDRFALYYVDVPIIATSKGNQFNVDAGQITQVDNVDFVYKMVSNPDDMLNGSKYETNPEYYERLLFSVNDRSLMNKRSIFAGLPKQFPVVRSIYISGPGDKYMSRDLISGTDVSVDAQKADYLGKISGENLVKHVAFSSIYPPVSGDLLKQDWGPFSVKSDHPFPLTIESVDITADISSSGQNGDPGLHGYPLNKEMTDDQYKGLYFDDFKTVSEIATVDVFNIEDEDVGLEAITTPSSEWVHGAQGKKRGNMGTLNDGISDIDVMNFLNNDITLSTGAKNSISVGKDIGKRIGLKVSGTLTFPTAEEENVSPVGTNLQIMVGGINSDTVDGYTGIGFGIRLERPYPGVDLEEEDGLAYLYNAVVYIAHSEKYGAAQIFTEQEDIDSHISITDIGALAEKQWRIVGGIEYDFEFIIHDDLRVTLYLNKTEERLASDPNDHENNMWFDLPSKALNVYSNELFNKDTTHYGTTMKVTLDSNDITADHSWIIRDLRVFDTQESRATKLFSINVSELEDPISLSLRAFGSGSVNDILTEGFESYIWDKEATSVASGETSLTSGAWALLEGISNPIGEKDVLSNLITSEINNLERYKVSSRYGESIFILVVASGTSKMNSLFFGKLQEDIQSELNVDYIKAEGEALFLYHANNKTDIYAATFTNSEPLEITSLSITKNTNENVFEISEINGGKMPISEILSVTVGSVVSETEALSDTEFQVVRPDPLLSGSSKEVIQIVLDNITTDTITVEYTTYPEIANMQNFFDGTEFGKLFGDILVKHKSPVELSFTVFFTGPVNDDQLIDEIRQYFDDNSDGTFSTKELISHIYNEGLANNIQEPIEISYTRRTDEGTIETGTFTDTLTIRDIDFFLLDDVSVSRL
jgi:hypothetical protein